MQTVFLSINFIISIMEFGVLDLLLVAIVLIASVYYYVSPKLSYWSNRKVPGPRPLPFFENIASVIFGRISLHELFAQLYREWRKYPFIGIYQGHTPVLLITDLDLIKTILIKDFNVFAGRGVTVNEDVDPLSEHLGYLDGLKWKYLRTKLTPVFTSGKLKHMFDLMLECADHYEDYLNEEIGNGRVIEFREVAAKFTTDVIGSCAFGISMNALSQEDSKFRKIGRRIFQSGHSTILTRMLRESIPKLFAKLKMKEISDDVTEFFTNTVKETIEFREKNNIVRHDFVDTLIDIRNKHDNKEFEFTDNMLTAQAFVFFFGGFGTTSTTISFGLYELAYAPECQEKLINEIRKTLEDNNGKLTYDVINGMKYLDMVIQETLRKNPPGTILRRKVYKPYTIPGTDVCLDPGTKIHISVYGIQHDPEYFPNPEVFDPERFTEEAKRLRHPMAFLAFGAGPRNCIGGRFGAYQVKLGLLKVLKNYRVKPSKLSPFPYKIDKSSVHLASVGGVNLRLEPIS